MGTLHDKPAIVTVPNFGEERAIADTLRWADLRVPVLIQATPDDRSKMTIASRRESFCGKMSACNNLRQYGIAANLATVASATTRYLGWEMYWHRDHEGC